MATSTRFTKAFLIARREAGMSQMQIANRIGVVQQAVSAWSTGSYEPGPTNVFALETALGKPPGSLSRYLGYIPVAAGGKAETAVVGDDSLTPQQQAAVLAVLATFR